MSEPWEEFWTAEVDSLALEMFERSHEPSFTDDARGMGEAREWAQRVVDEVRAAARREGQAEAWERGVRDHAAGYGMTPDPGPNPYRTGGRPVKCDRCGKFCKDLYPVYCNPPQGGIDHEVCDKCRNGEGQ